MEAVDRPGVCLSFSRPDRLVWIESDVEGGMRTTITFVDLNDGRTKVVTHQTNVPAAYLSAEARAGFGTSLDRFEAYVAGLDVRQQQRSEHRPEHPLE
ncbi:SRPBCC domain-containing protein [Actinomadura sp. HBU206391]|uniref:SRPBCC domain-containing protein n=1 Tax=Actinomadura sp. HBU206391 TaxID=2731692 RepID=UPI0039677AB7